MDEKDFNYSLGSLFKIRDGQSRSANFETPVTGGKGVAASFTEGQGRIHTRSLGLNWKISPNKFVPSGETAVLMDIGGPGVVQSMWFGGDISNEYILRIYWDGSQVPSVEVPLPCFFAYGWAKTPTNVFGGPFYPLNSIPVAVNPNKSLNCFWPMPFKKHCKVTIENRSERPYNCYYNIHYELTAVPGDAGYFHAQFRRSNPVKYKEAHIIVDGIQGKGQYVGTALFVGLNGAANWWGEGEVYFYIDGDSKFPTICSTGTEDYVGGSFDWEVDGKYVPYSTPYMGMYMVRQSDGLYNHQQRFSMYRWHIMDPIRFDKDLKVTIQDLGWDNPGDKYLARQDDIASVAYWYQSEPAKKFPKLADNDYVKII